MFCFCYNGATNETRATCPARSSNICTLVARSCSSATNTVPLLSSSGKERLASFPTRLRESLTNSGLAYALGLFAGKISSSAGIVRFGLRIMKLCGLFHVARYITRDGLRIICYHGFAVAEEHKFRGRLFIRKELFLRRIEYLRS